MIEDRGDLSIPGGAEVMVLADGRWSPGTVVGLCFKDQTYHLNVEGEDPLIKREWREITMAETAYMVNMGLGRVGIYHPRCVRRRSG